MHVMMTTEQFKMLKDKAKGGGGKTPAPTNGEDKDKDKKAGEAEHKLPKVTLKEEDDTHGTLDMDDALFEYYYNSQEGRLYLSVAKKHSLASYCAGDNICCTFLMDILSQMPNPTKKAGPESGGTAKGGSESEEKKAQTTSQ